MIKIEQFKTKKPCGEEALKALIAKRIGYSQDKLHAFKILRRSVDARKKPELLYVYSAAFTVPEEKKLLAKKHRGFVISKYEEHEFEFPGMKKLQGSCQNEKMQGGLRPLIVGSGPAGLFCALMLSQAGLRPLILERGQNVDDRMKTVNSFWQGGKLNPRSNVQFGEGGAGTFSDGKLNTSIHDRAGMAFFVLKTFVRYGAPEEILYDSHPHIGTDVLVSIIKNMRAHIISMGGEFRFESCVRDLEIKNGAVTGIFVDESNSRIKIAGDYEATIAAKEINNLESAVLNIPKSADIPASGNRLFPADRVVLATGHSARDTFEMLKRRGAFMEPKPFAVGLRIQHPQEMIDKALYGFSDDKYPCPAPYKLTYHTKDGRGVYSFCMCPGGYVVNASSEEGLLAVNGMSYSGRGSKNANSAIVVAVNPGDYLSEQDDNVLAGMEFQRQLERKAYMAGNGKIPAETFAGFKAKKVPGYFGGIKPCTKGQWEIADVRSIMPEYINRAFMEGMEAFGRRIEGFDRDDTILYGVESRTSSPVRIIRDEKYASNIKGLYPCGEGAGYAGGIVSAAVDGIKVALSLIGDNCT